MKICQSHWEELRAAIKAKGLWDLVSVSGQEALSKITREAEGIAESPENFDPLMSATLMLYGNGIRAGGISVMGMDANGQEFCPVCEADKHNDFGWIGKAVEGVAARADELANSQ